MTLGVGAIYWPGLHPLFAAGIDVLDHLEVEPQAFWQFNAGPGPRYLLNRRALDSIAALPQQKIVHGVGFPVGNATMDTDAVETLSQSIRLLNAQWSSEHLSFNQYQSTEGERASGFLLPPLQSPEGVQQAAAHIRTVSAKLPVPFAFETGVNYLRPRSGELSDGQFFGAVAEAADCGILLDLHNLWANERNGRCPVVDVLAECPLERVWEIHLAGGSELNGYYLDAHDGAIPDDLLQLVATLLPRLPNLRALIYEILPEHVTVFGIDGVARQIERLRELQRAVPQVAATARATEIRAIPLPAAEPDRIGAQSVAEWRATLGAAIESAAADAANAPQDPAISLYRHLAYLVRLGRAAELLRLSCTLIVLSKGIDELNRLLAQFDRLFPTHQFATVDADHLATYLSTLELDIRYLDEVLGFEHAGIRASLYGESRRVEFTADPAVLLESLLEGRLPAAFATGVFSVDVSPGSS